MTVETTASAVTQQGNGVTTEWDYAFLIPTEGDVEVSLMTDGERTVLDPSAYTIDGLGLPDGGTVVYPISGDPIAIGTSITIMRVMPYTQEVELSNQGNFYPSVVEGGLDNLMLQMQQIVYDLALTLRAEPGNPQDPLTPDQIEGIRSVADALEAIEAAAAAGVVTVNHATNTGLGEISDAVDGGIAQINTALQDAIDVINSIGDLEFDIEGNLVAAGFKLNREEPADQRVDPEPFSLPFADGSGRLLGGFNWGGEFLLGAGFSQVGLDVVRKQLFKDPLDVTDIEGTDVVDTRLSLDGTVVSSSYMGKGFDARRNVNKTHFWIKSTVSQDCLLLVYRGQSNAGPAGGKITGAKLSPFLSAMFETTRANQISGIFEWPETPFDDFQDMYDIESFGGNTVVNFWAAAINSQNADALEPLIPVVGFSSYRGGTDIRWFLAQNSEGNNIDHADEGTEDTFELEESMLSSEITDDGLDSTYVKVKTRAVGVAAWSTVDSKDYSTSGFGTGTVEIVLDTPVNTDTTHVRTMWVNPESNPGQEEVWTTTNNQGSVENMADIAVDTYGKIPILPLIVWQQGEDPGPDPPGYSDMLITIIDEDTASMQMIVEAAGGHNFLPHFLIHQVHDTPSQSNPTAIAEEQLSVAIASRDGSPGAPTAKTYITPVYMWPGKDAGVHPGFPGRVYSGEADAWYARRVYRNYKNGLDLYIGSVLITDVTEDGLFWHVEFSNPTAYPAQGSPLNLVASDGGALQFDDDFIGYAAPFLNRGFGIQIGGVQVTSNITSVEITDHNICTIGFSSIPTGADRYLTYGYTPRVNLTQLYGWFWPSTGGELRITTGLPCRQRTELLAQMGNARLPEEVCLYANRQKWSMP